MPGANLNGPPAEGGAPQIRSMSFEGTRGETWVHALEEKYIYVGTGSACSSHKKGESRVLRAMGVPPQVAQGTLRFSFCCMNTVEQAEIVADAVEEVDSCSACYGYRSPALDMLKQEGLLEKLHEKICSGQGYRGKSGELGVGHCTRNFKHHAEGCPPTENQIYEFLKEYISK